jgi:glycosyltransferase involved in cell wall biosynthesis
VEAAQVGVPSVAYVEAGGVRESILDGVTGLLATDRDDLAAKVRQLLSDADLRVDLGHKARIRSKQFSWDVTAETIADRLGT